ncbi:MAG: hypothetical protein EOO40_08310 [Deltaproteobacteria bacterium]|nr:MAG: hypothetical protein EOO40_08310 [Deltaproteobacteria bacterium]
MWTQACKGAEATRLSPILTMRHLHLLTVLSLVLGCRPTGGGRHAEQDESDAPAAASCCEPMHAFAAELVGLERETRGKAVRPTEQPGDLNQKPAGAQATRPRLSKLRAEWLAYQQDIEGRLTQLEQQQQGVRD